MLGNTLITVTEDITLITLQNAPADIHFLSDIFEQIGGMGVNIDMISLSPAQRAVTGLSFTVSDDDLVKVLEYTSTLRNASSVMRPAVSSGNCKISILDRRMDAIPGFAAKVFRAAASVNTDIRIITTSEIEISLLITKADADATIAAIEKALSMNPPPRNK